MLMSTDPGDLVLDITCGSGTTAYVAEQWGRRWISCDTSRVALTLAKQRLMTAHFDYYRLAHPEEGIGSGLEYEYVDTVSAKTLGEGEPPVQTVLYDRPLIERRKSRVSGPFTVEAVPAPQVGSFAATESEAPVAEEELADAAYEPGGTCGGDPAPGRMAGSAVAFRGARQGRQEIAVQPAWSPCWEHCIYRPRRRLPGRKMVAMGGGGGGANTAIPADWQPQRVLAVFGPEHAPLEQRTVENAWHEAQTLGTDILLFCAFQFDSEAAKDIDELSPAKVGMQLLKVQMNPDLLTGDLRKAGSSDQSFWLIGQPDIRLHHLGDDQLQVEVLGFDYYDPEGGGRIQSGSDKHIAMWMLDTDYDGRSPLPGTGIFSDVAGRGMEQVGEEPPCRHRPGEDGGLSRHEVTALPLR